MVRLRQFIILLLLTLLFPCFQPQHGFSASAPKLIVSSIDVGQGDSILVQFPDGETMLIDAGPQDAGQTVVNYLKSQHVTKIDILVVTHQHSDHGGGMIDVLESYPVGKVWDSGYVHGSKLQQQFLKTIKDKGIRYGKPKAGFTQAIGQAKIDVLAPVRELTGTDSDANNNSLVLRISYGKISFLLTGDLEEEERASIGNFPRTTVLKVAHHGSRNGTDRYFLSQVSPKFAVISYALGNSYGHPHVEALADLKASGAKIYGTGESGTVIVSTDGNTVSVKTLGSSSRAAPAYKSGSDNGLGGQAPGNGHCEFIGNKNSHKFHLPTCSSLPAPKNQVCFSSKEEAINNGFTPCKRCNP